VTNFIVAFGAPKADVDCAGEGDVVGIPGTALAIVLLPRDTSGAKGKERTGVLVFAGSLSLLIFYKTLKPVKLALIAINLESMLIGQS